MTSSSNHTTSENSRLHSLDALRGFDMFWIVCGEGIFHGFAKVVKEKYALTQSTVDWQITTDNRLSFFEKIIVGISNQLHHAVWNGFTFYDLIFPLFIFIAGVSMPFSLAALERKDGNNTVLARKQLLRTLLRRTIILIVLGMVVNGLLQFKGYENTRFASVLGRIALSCFFAGLIFLNTSWRSQLIWLAALLIGYWAAMMLIPVPGFGAGVLTPQGNLSAYIDRILLPGKLHRGVYDPEGLFSTIPAIGSALLGVLAGQILQQSNTSRERKTLYLLGSGLLLIGVGLLWCIVFPINKNIWTSSFVLYAGGWSALLLSLFYYVIDVKQLRGWSDPFVWIGVNSILIYMAAHGIINFEWTSEFLFGGLIRLMPVVWHDALLWIGVAIIQLAGLYFLYKKKWFLKV